MTLAISAIASANPNIVPSKPLIFEGREGRAHWEKSHQRLCAPGRKQHSQSRSQSGEQQTFRQQLPDDSRPSRAQRDPYRDFPRAGRRARQQQVRDIETGNQQHESHRRQKRQQSGPVLIV